MRPTYPKKAPLASVLQLAQERIFYFYDGRGAYKL
jgi:hypothetical protein